MAVCQLELKLLGVEAEVEGEEDGPSLDQGMDPQGEEVPSADQEGDGFLGLDPQAPKGRCKPSSFLKELDVGPASSGCLDGQPMRAPFRVRCEPVGDHQGKRPNLLKSGLRFSKKALCPSLASSVM